MTLGFKNSEIIHMKKSLITLLAVCSSALADTAITLSSDAPAIQSTELCVDIEGLSATTVSTPTFTMTIGNRLGDGYYIYAAMCSFGGSSYDVFFSVRSISPVLNESGNTLTLSGYVSFTDTPFFLKDNDFLAWAGVPQSALSFVLDSFDIFLKLDENSSIATMTRSISGRYFLIDGEAQGTKLDKTPMEYRAMVSGHAPIFEQLIPEPSTATLSLLALAGLCMRRRRN